MLNKVSFPNEVKQDTTLYAGWKQVKFTVTFKTDGGSDVADMAEVELPSEMNGRKVVKIGNEVFRDNEFITKVILPDTITTIAIRASDGCSNLTEVVLPNGFVSIGEWTFANCTALRSVDLGNLMEISDLVFNFTKSETLTIYCAESEKPDGWDVNWSKANGGVKVEVVWDFNSAAGMHRNNGNKNRYS